MNPYQPTEIQKPEPIVCEKCKAREKPLSTWSEVAGAFVFLAILFSILWAVGTALQLSGIRWIFVNERTG